MFNFIKSVLIKNKKRDLLLPQNETVNINGIEWATRNVGISNDKPAGGLYTIEQALLFENEEWELPTLDMIVDLKDARQNFKLTYDLNGLWLNNKLYFPFNRDYFEPSISNEKPMLNIAAIWIKTDISTSQQIYTEYSYVYWIKRKLPPHFFKRKTITPLNILCGVRLVKRESDHLG